MMFGTAVGAVTHKIVVMAMKDETVATDETVVTSETVVTGETIMGI